MPRAALIVFTILRYLGAMLFLFGAVFLFARLLTPTPAEEVYTLSEKEYTELEELRSSGIRADDPPVRWYDADYTESTGAAWWPKQDPDILQPLVAQKLLPPVDLHFS